MPAIINKFQGERKAFIAALFNNCTVKQKFTYVDMQAILNNYQTDRNRIIVALEYFEQKGLLELQAKQTLKVTSNYQPQKILILMN